MMNYTLVLELSSLTPTSKTATRATSQPSRVNANGFSGEINLPTLAVPILTQF